MMYQVTNSIPNVLSKIIGVISSIFDIIQKSMEASAYSRILTQHGHQLTEEQRERIRQSLIEIMNK